MAVSSSEPVDDAVDTGISNVVVAEAACALLLSSCSAGCSIFHPSSSRKGILVSIRSSWMSSVVGKGSGVGVGDGTPSRGARRSSARVVGCGSSSIGDARVMDAKNAASPTAAAHGVRGLRLVVVEEAHAKTWASGSWRMGRTSSRA